MSTNAERRRANRVQGAWNSSTNKSALTNKKVNAISKISNNSQNLLNQEPTNLLLSKQVNNSTQQYVFNEEVKEDLKSELRKPKVLSISEKGLYQLSIGYENVPATVQYFPNFLTASEADTLFNDLRFNLPWQQRTGLDSDGKAYKESRMTCWYGLPYTYSAVKWTESSNWPDSLDRLRHRLADRLGIEFNSMLANLYRDNKDSIGWHSDDEKSLGRHSTIASISLGATRCFQVRLKEGHEKKIVDEIRLADELNFHLNHGSLLIMAGSMQENWVHCVPKEYHDRDARINLTFRVIVNPPNEHIHMNVRESQDRRLSKRVDMPEAILRYCVELVDDKKLLRSVEHFLTRCQGWSNREDLYRESDAVGCQQLKLQVPWPVMLEQMSRVVLKKCDSFGFTLPRYLNCYLLHQPAHHLSWSTEEQRPCALVCIGDARSVELRKKKSSEQCARGHVKYVTISMRNGDMLFFSQLVLLDWQFRVPRDPKTSGRHTFIVIFDDTVGDDSALNASVEALSISNCCKESDVFPSVCSYHDSPCAVKIVDGVCSAGHLCFLCAECSESVAFQRTSACPLCALEQKRPVLLTQPTFKR